METYVVECGCGFQFVFAEKPSKQVKVACPKCGKGRMIDPAAKPAKETAKKDGEK